MSDTDLRDQIARLRLALRAVQSTTRSSCWCDPSWDIHTGGHQEKCELANAALGRAREAATMSAPPSKK